MPPKAACTTNLLFQLRKLMKNKVQVPQQIAAYIVPSDDKHQSEYLADSDKRRAFITGFTGTAGTAVITEKEAVLWTDGRYFLQAEAQLDSNWKLMKMGLKGTPTIPEWLCEVLPSDSSVGVDPMLYSAANWEATDKILKADGHSLLPVPTNLIDAIWTDRPNPPSHPIFVQPIELSGQPWEEKVKLLRAKMAKKRSSVLVISALDEIAWLLNLRGSDIQFNPCFFAYVILTADNIHFFVEESQLNVFEAEIKKHLNHEELLTVHPYGDILKELSNIISSTKDKVWISKSASYSLYSSIPDKRRFVEYSPVSEMKAVKNSTEIDGMRNAHVRDAVALCEYFAWLEDEVPKGNVTEMSGSDKLQELREKQDKFVSLSFDTISSVGPNSAIIHYRATKETNRQITTDDIYLCDSGAQFRDGTTDVTRTLHFGKPTQYEQECFTKVLKGHITLAKTVFPNGVKGVMLDSFARAALWESGLDYVHGTGHGVGSFLNVHEGPCAISTRHRPDEIPLEKGMVLSDEPGYYENGKFGFRVESLLVVVEAATKYNFLNKGFLTFEPLTLVPIQRKLLLPDLLTEEEMNWLNDYHQKCRDVIGEALMDQDKSNISEWLIKATEPIG